MALTASISLNPSGTVHVNTPIYAQMTLSNSDAVNAVTLQTVDPLVYGTSGAHATPGSTSCAVSPVPLGPNVPNMIAPSSSMIISFEVTFFDPSNGTYSIGANIYTVDGQSVAPTPATITVLQLPIAASGT